MGFTQAEAATAVGYERVDKLDRGERPIDLVLTLAMEALELRRYVKPGDLTPEGHDLAAAEGWGLFLDDNDRAIIQKDDQTRKFRSDEAAIAFVKQLADAGSKLHQAALAIHNANRVRMVAAA